MNGLFLSADMLVTDDTDEVILGYFWLRDNKCQWKFHSAMVIIAGVPVRLSCKSSKIARVRRIYVREEVSIPAD